jgi:hypothetical protein
VADKEKDAAKLLKMDPKNIIGRLTMIVLQTKQE